MTKNIKIFLIILLLSLPFWWGINVLEKNLGNFFFWQEFAENPQLLAAQANQLAFEENLRNLKPLRDKNIDDFKTEAQSVISVFLSNQGEERVLLVKNASQKLPMASLTKLMTAKIVLENYDLSEGIQISQQAVEQEEDLGKLKIGKVFSVQYLLYPLLMESSNDAAFALANDYPGMGEEKFIGLMNLAAQELNLKDTCFFNPSGLDPDEDEPDEKINYSTGIDLVKLTKELLKEPLIWEILATPKYKLYGPELVNTNKLLEEIPGIIGGKTGYTEEALSCFLLVSKAPKSKGVLINVILGSVEDRFEEMKKLTNWLQQAYLW